MPDANRSGFADVSALLEPGSIAVVGASSREGNLGGTITRLLTRYGYQGRIWPVGRGGEDVAGLSVLSSIREAPAAIDLAVIAVSAANAVRALTECGQAGVRSAIVLAGGFAEAGPRGRALQDELAGVAHRFGIALLGPNCLGLLNARRGVTASFASFLVHPTGELLDGDISMVSHSGGLTTIAQLLTQDRRRGFRYTVSTGNEAVLTAADFIYAFAHDPGTSVITCYLEGARDGGLLTRAFAAARENGKPVVVLKGGMTPQSAAAATAHTGTLVGEGRVWESVFDDLSVIRVDSMAEMLDVAWFLSANRHASVPSNRGLAAVTFGGGAGVLSADQASRAALSMAHLSQASSPRIAQLVPSIATIANPIDLTPEAFRTPESRERFGPVLDALEDDPSVGSIVLLMGPMGAGGSEIASQVVEFVGKTTKATAVSWPAPPPGADEVLRGCELPVFDEQARAIGVLGKLAAYGESLGRWRARSSAKPLDFPWQNALGVLEGRTVAPEDRCTPLLARAGLRVLRGCAVTSADEAVAAARGLGRAVALKGLSQTVTHRARAGLVVLGATSADEVRAGFDTVRARAGEVGAVLDAVYVQEMAERGGTELIVSGFRDPLFGPFVLCGAGGTLAEELDDVVLLPAPFGADDGERIPARLRTIRGRVARASARGLGEFLARFSQLVASAPYRTFVLELNPVMCFEDRVVAVDALLVVDEP